MMWHKKWIIGNWKMNGSRTENTNLLIDLRKFVVPSCAYVGVAVPYPYLTQVTDMLHGSAISCGAQDCSRFPDKGAYTGEVSAWMIADCGASFILVGHSERRSYFNEDTTLLRTKIEHTLTAALTPILCVGESLKDRKAGQETEIVGTQLEVLDGLVCTQIAVAYEPVWAIGTGVVADIEQIRAMHAFIHEKLLSMFGRNVRIQILYGGSVNAANAQNILSIPHVDGALVGGASLQADAFTHIIAAVETE